MTDEAYTTQLQAGLGLIEETVTLLGLWQPGVGANQLLKKALESGQIPNVSARRLRNIVTECFAPRYLRNDPPPAFFLKPLIPVLNQREREQFFFFYTCRANRILNDFVCEVYWPIYTSGKKFLSVETAQNFVIHANQDGKTHSFWSENTIRRVAGYLPGCLADYGLLERGLKSVRKFLPFRIEPLVAVFLAYDLHFAGKGDNSVIRDPDWSLFGLDHSDVLDIFKHLSLNNWFIIQSTGDVTRVGWKYQKMEEMVDALINVKF